jgi:hypothetical protein
MLASADIMRMRGITEEDMVQARRRTQGLIAAAVPDSKNKGSVKAEMTYSVFTMCYTCSRTKGA